MGLLKLDVYNVRNIQYAQIQPSLKFNFIYGLNGSGKSALLEAIFLVGRVKSFRSGNLSKVINYNAKEFVVSGDIKQKEKNIKIGVQYNHQQLITRIDQKTVKSKAKIAYGFPLQIIHPKSYRILDAGPQIRREFIDWGVFNLNPEYLPIWRRFKIALSQRNAALKTRLLNEVRVWNPELSYYGTIVDEYRCNYIQQLKPFFLEACKKLLGITEIEIKINTGWDPVLTYEQSLHNSTEKDLRYGFTGQGPHRGDLTVLVKKKQAKDYVSRGQLKLLVLALSMAQIKMLEQRKQFFGCFLADDLMAELDINSKEKVFRSLDEMNVQVFMTATDKENFVNGSALSNYKMFHVEHGVITEE